MGLRPRSFKRKLILLNGNRKASEVNLINVKCYDTVGKRVERRTMKHRKKRPITNFDVFPFFKKIKKRLITKCQKQTSKRTQGPRRVRVW